MDEHALDNTLDLNHVVILRRELLAEGVTDQQIRAMVKSGELHRVRHGAYVSGELWATCSATDRHRIMIRAVLKRAHPATVVTHISGAVERGAPVWGVSLDTVHTTRTDGRAGRREAGVVQHRNDLPDDQVEVVNGIPLSAPSRCAIEVSAVTTLEPALVTINGMLHQQMMSVDELTHMSAKLKHWPATLHNNVLLRLVDPRIESVAESRFVFLAWSQHLPRPEPQVNIFENGFLFARTDFAWPDEGVFLEFDGRLKYEIYRREGETLEGFLMREKRREERICAVTGWVCIRITWADLENPVRTAKRIRAVLESRRRPLGA